MPVAATTLGVPGGVHGCLGLEHVHEAIARGILRRLQLHPLQSTVFGAQVASRSLTTKVATQMRDIEETNLGQEPVLQTPRLALVGSRTRP